MATHSLATAYLRPWPGLLITAECAGGRCWDGIFHINSTQSWHWSQDLDVAVPYGSRTNHCITDAMISDQIRRILQFSWIRPVLHNSKGNTPSGGALNKCQEGCF